MSLVALVSALKPSVKVRLLADKPVIDNATFRAHYRLTSAIFFASCAFVTATNLIGNPINCIVDVTSVPENVINTYCWVRYTFTIPSRHGIYQGVVPSSGNDTEIRHAYYQWVPFMLFFHGLCFYLPHWIWKNCEGGTIKMISDGIRGTAIADNVDRKQKKSQVVNFLKETLHMHKKYAYTYFLCELLNFVNVIVTMLLINTFLNGAFLTYGTRVLKFAFSDQDERNDPMIEVFPRMTKCLFRKYGPSGGIQTHDALCVLALNNLNEKIYIFVWFWLLFLAVISFLAVAYTAALLTIPPFRQMVVTKRFKFGSKHNVNRLIKRTGGGDFLLLHLLGLNLNTMTFRDLLDDLNDKLRPADKSKSYSDDGQPAINTHPNNQSSIYPDINSMDTMELDRFRPTDPLIHDRKDSVKSV